ncbi:MAG TPA: carboxymuconolactone decarboxylase family protein [Hellea balneolensis]|uniref:Carboxymuconolactone decarboxylase family protein n=1 Tax=Hellea balneolensis TaxID=287478 RepID=A0A7C3C163_9PROT|nr:carboxymuconolactone decarboxylase family protein [Hellea balneolensis]
MHKKGMIMDERTKKAFDVAGKLFGDTMPDTGVPSEFGKASFGHVYGEIWGRDGLDLKTRSLITVAALVAMDKPAELRIHLRGALNIGWTKDELRELMLHLSYYAGFPTGIEGAKLLEEVFASDDP